MYVSESISRCLGSVSRNVGWYQGSFFMVFQGVSEDHRGIKRCSRLFRGVLENTGYFQKMFQGFMGFRRRSRRS